MQVNPSDIDWDSICIVSSDDGTPSIPLKKVTDLIRQTDQIVTKGFHKTNGKQIYECEVKGLIGKKVNTKVMFILSK